MFVNPTRLLRLAVASGAITVFAAACGSSDGGGAAGGGGAVTRETFPSQYASLWCERTTPCCRSMGRSNDATNCGYMVTMATGLQLGSFDPDRGAECLEAMRTWDCTTEEPRACRAVYQGRTPGSPCDASTDLECASSGYCDQNTGTCAAKKPLGGACDAPNECESGSCDSERSECVTNHESGGACLAMD